MNEPTLQNICAELSDQLLGQKFGKIFVIAKLQLAIDFRLSGGNYLFISVQPNASGVYLIERRVKELEKSSNLQLSFVSFLRKRLAHAVVNKIEKINDERILKLQLNAQNEFGQSKIYTLVVQLTGRSSNLFLLDERDFILDSLRETFGDGQENASKYASPIRKNVQKSDTKFEAFPIGEFDTLSKSLDNFHRQQKEKQLFQSKSQSAKAILNKEVKKKQRLRKKLARDLETHGDASKWKHYGDLLLANIATAIRSGEIITVVDYFDEATPKIEIRADENLSITEAAEKYFKRYTKARNAKKEIGKRLKIVESELENLKTKQNELEQVIAEKDIESVENFLGKSKKQHPPSRKNKKEASSYYREFQSSDGFDIYVGKRSKDNDHLTFRIAKSLDTWMHAADYPGSHVVIRNPNRTEIPHRTLIEAAQLAAFYSKAKNESKVGVHYTQKKFVNKPKGAVAGLVSLASFKTILVKPKVLDKKNDE